MLLSYDFEKIAYEHLYRTLNKCSSGRVKANINGYMSHIRRFRNFVFSNYNLEIGMEEKKDDGDHINHIEKKKSVVSPVSTYSVKNYGVDIKKATEAVNKFYTELEADSNARFLSWEHCYKEFQRSKDLDINSKELLDYLALHLSFYLASWGMLRGSSFLLQKDYKVQYDIVKELFREKYSSLWNIDCKGLQQEDNLSLLMELIYTLKSIYEEKRANVKSVENEVSDILITKVLMGTLGCLPAYDRYFKAALGKYKISTQNLKENSIVGLAKYYEEYEEELESVRKKISTARGLEYPQMKVLDMAFWQLGFDMSVENES